VSDLPDDVRVVEYESHNGETGWYVMHGKWEWLHRRTVLVWGRETRFG